MNYNKLFSLDDHIGKDISEKEFQCLLADGKIWITTCRMYGFQAAKAMNKPESDFEFDERAYGGQIFADDFEQAVLIANERGFGEIVEGVLCGIISYDSPMINPCNLSDHRN